MKLKENIYLAIPMICIGVWAFHYAVFSDFFLYSNFDFYALYMVGKQVFINPKNLYEVKGMAYMPSFAILFAFSISLFPLNIAWSIWYIMNILFGMLFVREFNKILIFINVKEKLYRFLFLIIISNGYFILQHFALNQSKYLVGVLVAYIIRRELQYNYFESEKNFRFYLVNYGFFIFILGITPCFIFLFLIYIFHKVPRRELFNKENLKRYGIVILMFFAQNFFFIIYPSMIIDYYKVYRTFSNRMQFDHFYLIYFTKHIRSVNLVITVNNIFTIILFIITFLLISNKKLRLIEKFGYMSLSIIFLYPHSWRVLIILLPFTVLLFVHFLNQNAKGVEFIKQNKIVLTGMISVLGISLTPFGGIGIYPRWDGIYLFFLFYLSILICCLLILNFKKASKKDVYKNIAHNLK